VNWLRRERGARDLQTIFSRAPWRSRVLFYLGVFCCFAPVGLLKEMQTLGAAPASYLVAQGTFSGLLAVSWAACAIHARRWFPLVIAVTIVSFFGLRHWFPPPVLPESLSSSAIADLKTRMTTMAVATIYIIALAYVSFVTFILGEGRRSFRAYTEIRLAHDLHASLVPATSGSTGGVSWRGASRPSGDVGGDLVDAVTEESDFFGCVADVTGHGVAAGVLMGMFKTAVHASLPDARDLGDLVTRINRTLSPLTQSNMFVTCACVHVAGPGRIEYVLAGHPSFLHVSTRTGVTAWVGEQQLAVGLIDDVVYDSRTIDVDPGDLIVVITDGLTEVFNSRHEEFGADGLADVVRALPAGSDLDVIEAAIFNAAQRHGRQTDDQTLLVMRV
jgi:sigma-B regulation protein RsbU (phosphoserine phosphatase)